MMLLRSQSISYFNVKRTIWLKVYQKFLAAVVLTALCGCRSGNPESR